MNLLIPHTLQRVTVAVSMGALALVCAGCQSVGAFAGATTAIISGAATTNPAVGIGLGIAVQAATDEAIKRTMKKLHNDQQEVIASIAGDAPIGTMNNWEVAHMVPLENGHGRVLVLRDVNSALAQCREFVFSVGEGKASEPIVKEQWFTANICKQSSGWKWASAEPATQRWGSLH